MAAAAPRARAQLSSGSTYAGSRACARCHEPIAARWRQTRMANVVRDPREHPEAIDLSRTVGAPHPRARTNS
jgi:hypothetical protein